MNVIITMNMPPDIDMLSKVAGHSLRFELVSTDTAQRTFGLTSSLMIPQATFYSVPNGKYRVTVTRRAGKKVIGEPATSVFQVLERRAVDATQRVELAFREP